jgi:hypothetical protein
MLLGQAEKWSASNDDTTTIGGRKLEDEP